MVSQLILKRILVASLKGYKGTVSIVYLDKDMAELQEKDL